MHIYIYMYYPYTFIKRLLPDLCPLLYFLHPYKWPAHILKSLKSDIGTKTRSTRCAAKELAAEMSYSNFRPAIEFLRTVTIVLESFTNNSSFAAS